MEVVTVVLGDPVVPGVGETVMSTRVQVVPFRSVSFRFVPFRSFSTTGVTRFPEKALSRSPRMALSSLHGSGSDPATAVLNETDGGVEAGLPEGTETAVLVLTSALLTAALLLSPLL